MASDKDVTNYWVRNDINGDVAGPFSTAQMSDYLKTLPKDKFGFYKVKSSKWNDWKPLVSVIKEKSASGSSDAPSVPLNPPKAPVKSSTPPATPKVLAVEKSAPKKNPVSGGDDLKVSSTGGAGFWDADVKSDSKISVQIASPSTPKKGEEAVSEDFFGDALSKNEDSSFESSLNSIEKAKIGNVRQYPRFKVDVEVTFIGIGGEKFTTLTKDLSLGGMQFDAPVPMNMFEDSALVSLYNHNARQRFSANLLAVGDAKGFANRACFNYLSPKNLEILHEWLKSSEAILLKDERILALKKKKT